MDRSSHRIDAAFQRRGEEVCLEFDGREPRCAFAQVCDRCVAAKCIGKCHQAACVQETVGRVMVALNIEMAFKAITSGMGDHQPDMAGKRAFAPAVERLWGQL